MNSNERKQGSITKPLLKELLDRQKAESQIVMRQPFIGSTPLKSSDLFQDPGSGYNPDFTFPQE